MKILVIHTGGTIACNNVDGVLKAQSHSPVVKEYLKTKTDEIEFCEEFFSALLSENADDSFYEKFINYLSHRDLNGFSAVIVLCGTDTLSYFSSLCAMCLRHFCVPVAFVSSNYIIEDENSNGVENFSLAVSYFKDEGNGFVVPYKNKDGRRLIHLATRILPADSVTDSFSSFGNLPLAEAVGTYLVSYGADKLPTNEELGLKQEKLFSGEVSFSKKILIINAYPGIDYSLFDFSKNKPAAILHTAYHSGTANSDLLPDFIEKCKTNGIDFYLCPVKPDAVLYETTKKIIDCGAVPIYNMNIPSAVAKLKIKYNIKNINPNENLYFESI